MVQQPLDARFTSKTVVWHNRRKYLLYIGSSFSNIPIRTFLNLKQILVCMLLQVPFLF